VTKKCAPNREPDEPSRVGDLPRKAIGEAPRMEMSMLEMSGFFAFPILVADIYAIYKTWKSRASDLWKAIWTAIIFFLPLLGFIVWLLFGPKRAA